MTQFFALALFSLAVTPVFSQVSEVDFTIDMLKSTGNLSSSAECLNIDENKFETALRQSMPLCFKQHGFEDENAIDSCMLEKISEITGVSQTQVEQCSNQADENYDAAQQKELSPSMDLLRRSDAKNLDQITLPLYPKSQIIIHNTTGIKMPSLSGNVQALPSASLRSDDSAESIVAFYKKTLPEFELKPLRNGAILLMKKIPPNFSIIKNYEKFRTSEHILIKKDGNATTIEIAYSPK